MLFQYVDIYSRPCLSVIFKEKIITIGVCQGIVCTCFIYTRNLLLKGNVYFLCYWFFLLISF